MGALLAAVGSAMAKGSSGYSSGGGYHSSGYRSSTVSLAVLPLHLLNHWVPCAGRLLISGSLITSHPLVSARGPPRGRMAGAMSS